MSNMANYMAPDSILLLSADLHEYTDSMHPASLTLYDFYDYASKLGLTVVYRDCGIGKYGEAYGNGRAMTLKYRHEAIV
jgi:hypothetical protein